MNHADVDIQGFGLPNQNGSATKWTSVQTHALLILTKPKKKKKLGRHSKVLISPLQSN